MIGFDPGFPWWLYDVLAQVDRIWAAFAWVSDGANRLTGEGRRQLDELLATLRGWVAALLHEPRWAA
jgi:hypothetical protein